MCIFTAYVIISFILNCEKLVYAKYFDVLLFIAMQSLNINIPIYYEKIKIRQLYRSRFRQTRPPAARRLGIEILLILVTGLRNPPRK